MILCKQMSRSELIAFNSNKRVRFDIDNCLHIHHAENGESHFVFLYHIIVGNVKYQREIDLGTFPNIRLSQANRRARKCSEYLAKGLSIEKLMYS